MQTMKFSKNWFNGLRSVVVLLVTVGFYGWTPLPVNAAVECNEKISFTDLVLRVIPISSTRVKSSQTMTPSSISCQNLLSMQMVK